MSQLHKGVGWLREGSTVVATVVSCPRQHLGAGHTKQAGPMQTCKCVQAGPDALPQHSGGPLTWPHPIYTAADAQQTPTW